MGVGRNKAKRELDNCSLPIQYLPPSFRCPNDAYLALAPHLRFYESRPGLGERSFGVSSRSHVRLGKPETQDVQTLGLEPAPRPQGAGRTPRCSLAELLHTSLRQDGDLALSASTRRNSRDHRPTLLSRRPRRLACALHS